MEPCFWNIASCLESSENFKAEFPVADHDAEDLDSFLSEVSKWSPITEALWVLEGPFSAGRTQWLLRKGTLVYSLRQCVIGSRESISSVHHSRSYSRFLEQRGIGKKNNMNEGLKNLLKNRAGSFPFSPPQVFPTYPVAGGSGQSSFSLIPLWLP